MRAPCLAGRSRSCSLSAGCALSRACGALRTRVMCTFIMAKAKQKVTVPGLVGWSLLDTAKHHGLLNHCTHDDT